MGNNEKQDMTKKETLGEGLIREGHQVVKTEVGPEQFYQTAIAVQKPRDLEKVRLAALYEAEIAGELFYYQWEVTLKEGKKRLISGVTIHGAMAIARNFGNCAVPINAEVDPLDGSVMFKAAFVDIETGFTVSRNFRAHFIQPPGKFEKDPGQRARWFDMQFQKAQSQAQRNVILKGVPFWLVDMVQRTAKDSAFGNIKKMGIEKARVAAVKKFKEEYGIEQATLEKHLGKEVTAWTIQDAVTLKSILRALEEGFDSPETIFAEAGHTDGAVIDVEDIFDAFWKIVATRGIERDDQDMVRYVKGVAAFAKSGEANYVADLNAAFADPAELDRFMATFKEKKEKGEIPVPAKGQGDLFK
jgi:hypothetical protein